jgi:hypothetical protein
MLRDDHRSSRIFNNMRMGSPDQGGGNGSRTATCAEPISSGGAQGIGWVPYKRKRERFVARKTVHETRASHANAGWPHCRLRSEFSHRSSDSTEQLDHQAATNKALKAESLSLTGSARVLLFWSTIVMAWPDVSD